MFLSLHPSAEFAFWAPMISHLSLLHQVTFVTAASTYLTQELSNCFLSLQSCLMARFGLKSYLMLLLHAITISILVNMITLPLS